MTKNYLTGPNARRAVLIAAIAAISLPTFAEGRGYFARKVDQVLQSIVQNPAPLVPGRDGPLALPAGEGFLGCPHLFPNAVPFDVRVVPSQDGAIALCSNNFAVLTSTTSKAPIFVIERLSSALLNDAKDEERTNNFYADPRLPRGARAELSDYRGSGLDRGHLANAADQPDQQSMIQSFALSNMVPQDPYSNRKGAWFKAEMDTRKYARRARGDVFVYSGPLFRGDIRTIGANRVWVPSHLFKLVYDASSGRAWAHIVENSADGRLGQPMGYPEFVQQTGLDLLPRTVALY